jgi:hypothetical protein
MNDCEKFSTKNSMEMYTNNKDESSRNSNKKRTLRIMNESRGSKWKKKLS